MGRAILAGIVTVMACGALAAPAAADPAQDYQGIRADWTADGVITPCRWSEQQLENARFVSAFVPQDQYTEFPAAIDREIARWRAGRCSGQVPDGRRASSALASVTIVRVSGRGKAARELVRIRNRGNRTVSLAGATLRNRRGHRVRLPRIVLRRGQTATVRLGCRRGKRRVVRTRAWLCYRRAGGLFADRGDVARLADRRGIVVSQRGFGSQRRADSF
jgi:hypothetical protein